MVGTWAARVPALQERAGVLDARRSGSRSPAWRRARSSRCRSPAGARRATAAADHARVRDGARVRAAAPGARDERRGADPRRRRARRGQRRHRRRDERPRRRGRAARSGARSCRRCTRASASAGCSAPASARCSRRPGVDVRVELRCDGARHGRRWRSPRRRACCRRDADAAPPGGRLALPPRALWPLGLIAFCCMLAEGAAADWSAVYLHGPLGAGAGVAALGFTAFCVAMTGAAPRRRPPDAARRRRSGSCAAARCSRRSASARRC